ncbi:MAG: hypothetical protein J6Y02_23925 [Pseudobutyrivibrio sp.]|nr:hypothetical protein [Pseudobutyrivibrio sp.]
MSIAIYFKWLLNKVNFNGLVGLRKGGFPASLSYKTLLFFLFNKDYKCVIERDENRIQDGLGLRYEFLDDTDSELIDINEHVSVLEVLIALAVRADLEYIGDPGDPHPELIFWEMICNLGLDKFDDSRWAVGEAERIIDIWLLREYDFNGNGGIFPLHVATFDQRKVELWSQMMSYISENG